MILWRKATNHPRPGTFQSLPGFTRVLSAGTLREVARDDYTQTYEVVGMSDSGRVQTYRFTLANEEAIAIAEGIQR